MVIVHTYQLSILTHSYCRKKIFNQVRHFIHVNLSAALLLGLIVFVSGIEAASDLRVRDDTLDAG